MGQMCVQAWQARVAVTGRHLVSSIALTVLFEAGSLTELRLANSASLAVQ